MDHLEKVEPKVQAFITVTREEALKQAAEADKRLASGKDLTPLTGVPIAIKDLLCTKGIRTTCASRMLENFIPPYNATVVEKLYMAGAVSVGKTNMDEFAMGSSTETSYFKKTQQSLEFELRAGRLLGRVGRLRFRRPGLSPPLGSDTGGSIRQPAALCGIVGMKPTYGRVSRYGLIAFASSLDQVGPFGKDVEDCAIMLAAIAGHDPKDSTSANVPVPRLFKSKCVKGVKGLKVGIPKEFFPEGMNKEVADSVKDAIAKLESLGQNPWRFPCLPPPMDWPLITFSRLPRLHPTWPVMTGCATALGFPARISWKCIPRPAPRGSGPRSNAASCWAPTPFPPATTTPIT